MVNRSSICHRTGAGSSGSRHELSHMETSRILHVSSNSARSSTLEGVIINTY